MVGYLILSSEWKCQVCSLESIFTSLSQKCLIDRQILRKKKHVCFEGFFLKKKNSLVFTSFWWLKPFTNKKRREGVYRMWSSYLKHQSSSFSKVWGRSGVKVNTEPLTMRSRLLPKNDGKNVVFFLKRKWQEEMMWKKNGNISFT